MDQAKTGKFIKEMRKERGLTQRQLAEKLNISEKTVSKWETGNGLPDTGLMLPLCEALNITVNELLSAERLNEMQYFDRAEENLAAFLQDRVSGTTKSVVAMVSFVAVMLSATGLIVVCAGYADIPTWLRIVLIVAAFLAIFSFTALVCVLGASSEIFECPRCGKKFSVSLAAYIFGMHTTSKRKLKCPHCGKTSWCRSFWRK